MQVVDHQGDHQGGMPVEGAPQQAVMYALDRPGPAVGLEMTMPKLSLGWPGAV